VECDEPGPWYNIPPFLFALLLRPNRMLEPEIWTDTLYPELIHLLMNNYCRWVLPPPAPLRTVGWYNSYEVSVKVWDAIIKGRSQPRRWNAGSTWKAVMTLEKITENNGKTRVYMMTQTHQLCCWCAERKDVLQSNDRGALLKYPWMCSRCLWTAQELYHNSPAPKYWEWDEYEDAFFNPFRTAKGHDAASLTRPYYG
jgi:hypothetical protein